MKSVKQPPFFPSPGTTQLQTAKVSNIPAKSLLSQDQSYLHQVLQTIQMKLILLWVWAERAVLGRAKTALEFKYEI